jgi:ribokinase
MSVVVFGSVNADLFVAVETLPRPGETVLSPTYALAAGGKGANQAVAAARVGAAVRMFGRIGNDGFGKTLRDGLAREGIDVAGVVPCEAPTGAAFIAVDGRGENMIFGAGGANLRAEAAQVPNSALTSGTTLILQMEVPVVESAALAERTRARGARVVFNMAPALPVPEALLRATSVFVANEGESAALARQLGWDAVAPQETCRRLASEFALTAVVTLGGDGAVAATPEAIWMVPALPVAAIDTVGAGDAFVGVLAASLDRGHDLAMALRRASVAGALACEKSGAQAGLPDEATLTRRLAAMPEPRRVPDA